MEVRVHIFLASALTLVTLSPAKQSPAPTRQKAGRDARSESTPDSSANQPVARRLQDI
jgi:hypothetical protein